MASKPLKICSAPGCSRLCRDGRCEKHKTTKRQSWEDYERRNPGKTRAKRKFFNSKAWQKLRRWVLVQHPVCQECGHRKAVEVHHVEPRDQRPDLALDEDNLLAVCSACHKSIEARRRVEP